MADSSLRMGCRIVEEDGFQAIALSTPVLRREKVVRKQRLCREPLL